MERAISWRCHCPRGETKQVNLVLTPETEVINSMLGWIFSTQP